MLELRPARTEDAARLTEIALAAKAHWGYPEAWLELWRPELTFDAELIARDWVLVAENGGRAVAVAVLTGLPPRLELSHLWVDPPAIGGGIGRRLFDAVVAEVARRGARCLQIVSDPYAEGFYDRMGARTISQIASQPAGRRLPLMLYEL